MSTLPSQAIRVLCKSRKPLISPFSERDVVAGMSFGLSACSYDVRIAENIKMAPGDFVLASTIERFQLPTNLVAFVHDKSSWKRRGLCVGNTLLDPGWRGFLTLELTNDSKEEIKIFSGWPIAQVRFELLAEPTKQPYKGKYQDQEAGPQPPREEII